MEGSRKQHSCRLTTYGDSGRVRWCVGQENTWKSFLKILVFLPLILLSLISIPLVIKLFLINAKLEAEEREFERTTVRYSNRETLDNQDRDIYDGMQTEYFRHTPYLYELVHDGEKVRYKRNVYFPAEKRDFSASHKHAYNGSVEPPESKFSKWKILTSDIDKVINLRVDGNLKINDYEKAIHYWKNRITRKEVRKRQAQIMQQYMNNEVDPCTDFYEFSCGNWHNYNKIPPDKTGYDTFEKLRESLDIVLRDLLLEEDLTENDDKENDTYRRSVDPFRKIKKMYRSCINEDVINERAESPLLQTLETLGGWPVIDDNWNETEFDWLWLVARLRLYNNDILISEWIGPDIRNVNKNIIQLDQTTLGLPSRDYFIKKSNIKYLEAYRIYMITAANLLGAPIIRATQDADKMIDFETNLAMITASQYERQNLTEISAPMTLGQLQSKIPQIDFISYMSMLMNVDMGPEIPIVCFSMKYFYKLVNLLSKTPPRTIANYILWRFIHHSMNNLDSRFLAAKQRFHFVLYGREQLPPRWQTCASQVNSNMGMALGHLFVKNYFDLESKNNTLQMTQDIQNSFYDILSDVDWLDIETKLLALLKINAMQLRIGYPDFVLNKTALAKKYMMVKINENKYFENILSILEHLSYDEHLRYNTRVNSLWNTPPGVVNAYYSRNKNQIMFPAGILQPPLYHKHFPRSLNYGGIGVVIGHEITHGFDDKGKLFDKEGNLKKWWTDAAIDAFHERSQCLVDQYNSYIIPELDENINGLSTHGANIADNSGLTQAFKAYSGWLKRNPHEDESLPGMSMSNAQLFFLNFAQIWCGISQPESLRNKVKTAIHSPGRFRVIGTIRNSKDFAEAYGCPTGSPMNPRNKCNIW